MASGSTSLEREEIICLAKMFFKAYKSGIIDKNENFVYWKEEHDSVYDFVNEYFKEYASRDLISLSCICLYNPDIIRSILYTIDGYDDSEGYVFKIYSNVEDHYFNVLNPNAISNKDLLYFCPNVLSSDEIKWSYKTGISSIEDTIVGFYESFVPFDCYYFHIYMKDGKLTIDGMKENDWKEISIKEEVTSLLVKHILKNIDINPNKVSDLYIANYQSDLIMYKGYITRKLPNGELVVTVY